MLLGLAGLAAGGIAVFVTRLEAGPVALLLVGLVLLLVGIGGRLPSRLRVGDNEAAWDAVETFVERVAEDATPSRRPDLLEALDDLAGAAPQLVGSAISAIAYENLTFEMLSTVVMRLNQLDEGTIGVPEYMVQRNQRVTTMAGAAMATAVEADALISTPSGAKVVVEISGSSRGITTATVSKLAAWLDPQISDTTSSYFDLVRASSVLLITRASLTHQGRALVENLSHRLVHVTVRGTEDEERLAQAVIEALRRGEGKA